MENPKEFTKDPKGMWSSKRIADRAAQKLHREILFKNSPEDFPKELLRYFPQEFLMGFPIPFPIPPGISSRILSEDFVQKFIKRF